MNLEVFAVREFVARLDAMLQVIQVCHSAGVDYPDDVYEFFGSALIECGSDTAKLRAAMMNLKMELDGDPSSDDGAIIYIKDVPAGTKSLKIKAAAEAQADKPRLVVQTGHGSGRDSDVVMEDMLEKVTRKFTAVLSDDGTQLVTVGGDNTPRLWDVESAKEIRKFVGHELKATSVALFSDGKRMITGGQDDVAILWDISSGEVIRRFTGHTGAVMAVALAKGECQFFSGGVDETVRLWDIESGRQSLRRFDGHDYFVRSLVLDDESRLLATLDFDKTVRVWDVKQGKVYRTLTSDTGRFTSVAISPDGKHVAIGSHDEEKNAPRLFDLTNGKELELEEIYSTVTSLAFSPDGKLLLAGDSISQAVGWDLKTMRIVVGDDFGQQAVTVMASSHGEPTRPTSVDPLAAIIEQLGVEQSDFEGQSKHISSVALRMADDSVRMVVGKQDASAYVVSLKDEEHEKQEFIGRSTGITSLALSSDGRFLATGSLNTAQYWNLWDGQQERTFTPHIARDITVGWVKSVALTATGKIATLFDQAPTKSSRDNYLLQGSVYCIWDFETREKEVKPERAIPAHTVASSADGHRVVIAGDDFLVMMDGQLNDDILQFQETGKRAISLTLSADGQRLVAGYFDNTARIFNAKTGVLIHTLEGHDKPVLSVDISTDGRHVLTGSVDHHARLWDSDSGQLLHEFGGHIDNVNSVAFSVDGKTFLTGSEDGMARLWDVDSKDVIHHFEGHSDSVTSVAFAKNGKIVLTGSEDCTVRLWDATTGQELCQLVSFQEENDWAVVDPHGRYDASNGGDVDGLHWVVGDEPISLDQLKHRYYEPGLLAKIMGFHTEPLRKVRSFANPKLYPEVHVSAATPEDLNIKVDLKNQGGGFGRVVVKINGKELTDDARSFEDRQVQARGDQLQIELDVSGDPRLQPGENNVEVFAYNEAGYLCSRGVRRIIRVDGDGDSAEPNVWAIIAGVSQYDSNSINDLTYAADDAEDFANALDIASKRLFGADKFHLRLLTTTKSQADYPTRANIKSALSSWRSRIKSGDILIIFLSGHGQNYGDDYYFMTSDAASDKLEDPSSRETVISSTEITEEIKRLPALKQVMILDTCASGQFINAFATHRSIPSSQKRALERVKDRTGIHVLAGCAADAVSFEASKYAQGLLTYSLLFGMQRPGYVDVTKLFSDVVDRVGELAKDIGGIQRPQYAIPKGSGSFDIGQVTEDDDIPLQNPRPIVLSSRFYEATSYDDSSRLAELVDEQLRDLSSRGRNAPLVFIDVRSFPDAFRIRGEYAIVAGQVQLSANIFKERQKHASFTINGVSEPQELATRIINEIKSRLV